MKFSPDVTNEELFLWIMHRVSEVFKEHAILKGGMVLSLLDIERKTIDLDYVFIPFKSKKEIEKKLMKLVAEIEGAKISQTINSKAIRIIIHIHKATAQIEANVELDCKNEVISTKSLAQKYNEAPRLIRIMSLDVALSHKLAAWNERRLHRDLLDIYILSKKMNILPEIDVLNKRLQNIDSRIKSQKNKKTMDIQEFCQILKNETNKLTQEDLHNGLAGIIPIDDIFGLDKKIQIAVYDLCDKLTQK